MSTVSKASQGRRAPSIHTQLPSNTPSDPFECLFTSYKFLTPAGSRLYHFIHPNGRNIHPPTHQGAHTSTADIVDGQNQIQSCSMTSHIPSQSSLLGVPREIRDMILRYALPDVTFCVRESRSASWHDDSSNNDQNDNEERTTIEDMTAKVTLHPSDYRVQRSIHLSVDTGGAAIPTLKKSNLHTALALLSTNHQLRLEFQLILILYAPTSFVIDSTRGSPTFTLANETLRTLDSAELRKISHLSLLGLGPPTGDRDSPMRRHQTVRMLSLANYYYEQQDLFSKLGADMRLKTLFLQIDVDDICWYLPAMQVDCSWLQHFWQLPGLSESKFQFTISRERVSEHNSGENLRELVRELNILPGVSADIVLKE